MKRAIVLLADGFEEVEAVTPIDYLRRAGIETITAAISGNISVKGARGITVNADTTVQELTQKGEATAASWDAVIVPGGMPGATNLAASSQAAALLKETAAAGKWVCAICASPAVVLAPLGLLSGKPFTCYPGMEAKVQDGEWSGESVVIAASASGKGGIITSRGAGTAGAFAVAIIGQLIDEATATKIAQAVLL